MPSYFPCAFFKIPVLWLWMCMVIFNAFIPGDVEMLNSLGTIK